MAYLLQAHWLMQTMNDRGRGHAAARRERRVELTTRAARAAMTLRVHLSEGGAEPLSLGARAARRERSVVSVADFSLAEAAFNPNPGPLR